MLTIESCVSLYNFIQIHRINCRENWTWLHKPKYYGLLCWRVQLFYIIDPVYISIKKQTYTCALNQFCKISSKIWPLDEYQIVCKLVSLVGSECALIDSPYIASHRQFIVSSHYTSIHCINSLYIHSLHPLFCTSLYICT